MTELGDLDGEALAFLLGVSGESVTYTTVGVTNTTSNITALALEQQFAITDDKENKKFVVAASAVASPSRGDLITEAGGEVWSILDIQSRVQGTHWLLFGIRAQEVS